MKIETLLNQVRQLSKEWASQLEDRQQRIEADSADYEALREIGVPLMAVPVAFGGTWQDIAQSARPFCTMLRTLAQGDPSVTLASSIHQGVLASWWIPAVPEPYNDVRNHPWDGSTGMRLAAPWRGHGMKSTNSHAFEFNNFPATRVAWPGHQSEIIAATRGLGGMSWCSVVAGVVDLAIDYTREQLQTMRSKGSNLRAYEQVEWARAEQEVFLIERAWEGALQVLDQGIIDPRTILMTKEAMGWLSESALSRLCRLTGGTADTGYYPLEGWLKDVQILGWCRDIFCGEMTSG
jgi:alkylation response protein AidB-like acyl-CoA dehydrogenase